MNEDVRKNFETEAPQATSYEVRRYEEENGEGNDDLELELMAQDEIFETLKFTFNKIC